MPITRIVRLVFERQHTAAFEEIFLASRDKIAAFPGCLSVSLKVDHDHPHIYYTVSYWQSESDLQAYRQSELFLSTWARTKILFSDKPSAYTIVDVDL
jgi:heme oxygenase (mycobilin-producing)